MIAELERIQLELDQLRARPGGSYSRYGSVSRDPHTASHHLAPGPDPGAL